MKSVFLLGLIVLASSFPSTRNAGENRDEEISNDVLNKLVQDREERRESDPEPMRDPERMRECPPPDRQCANAVEELSPDLLKELVRDNARRRDCYVANGVSYRGISATSEFGRSC